MNKIYVIFICIIQLSACSTNKKINTIEPKIGLSKLLPKYWGKGGLAIHEPFVKGVYIAQVNDTTPKKIEKIKISVNDLITYDPTKKRKKSTRFPTKEAPIKINIATADPKSGLPIAYFFRTDTLISSRENWLELDISKIDIDLSETPIFIKIAPLTNLEYKKMGFEGPPVFPLIGNYDKNSFIPFTKNLKNKWEIDTYLASRNSIYQISIIIK